MGESMIIAFVCLIRMDRKDPIEIGLSFLRVTKQNPKYSNTVSTVAFVFSLTYCTGFICFQLYQSYFNERDHNVFKTIYHVFSAYMVSMLNVNK